MKFFGPTLVAFALVACSSGGAETAAEATPTASESRHPESGLEVIPLTVTSGDKVHSFMVEVADTPEAQAKGMMFRTEMGADEGMLFPRDGTAQASFWMRNTYIPLDLIFVGVDGRISNIIANAQPYSEAPLLSDGVAAAVLELNGGRAEELGIVAGNKVEW
ncbi:DUF192 domain-containing protein [Altererythrobacter sp. ZODW24]|uniref:DUF192 domain-containing protein n=1 Tax=Altererythrobacter sp. ZODW24 TaxID=2185142 RepID=UPI000DF7BEAA|nr:DUF192 domain-containing protein [Altererythrobacter sp. ZODW24]